MKDFLFFMLAGVIAAATADVLDGHDPRLMGFGCEGAKGVLYAMEEDEFPPCAQIVENN